MSRGPEKHVTIPLVEAPSSDYSLDSFGLKERIGSVHCQLLSSGSNRQILLQSSDVRSLLLVRSHVLQRMLDQWGKGTKGWMVNYPQQQPIEKCMRRLETLPESIPDQIKELTEVNTVLASLLQLFRVCFKLAFVLSNHYSPKRRRCFQNRVFRNCCCRFEMERDWKKGVIPRDQRIPRPNHPK